MNSVKSYMYRTYVFTNMYLEGVRAGVQGAHALARLVVLHPILAMDVLSKDETLIFIQWGDSQALEHLLRRLDVRDIKAVEFCEPGLNNAITAVAAFIPTTVFDLEDDATLDPIGQEIRSKRLTP